MNILSDLSRTVLFPRDEQYQGSLNALYKQVKDRPGFQFTDHYVVNEHLLKQYQEIKQSGNKIYLLTTGVVQEDPAVGDALSVFDQVFTEASIGGLVKTSEYAYLEVCDLVNLAPNELFFIDDTLENIQAAQLAGLNALQYKPGLIIPT